MSKKLVIEVDGHTRAAAWLIVGAVLGIGFVIGLAVGWTL